MSQKKMQSSRPLFFHRWTGIFYKMNSHLRWLSGIYAENTLTWYGLRWIYAENAQSREQKSHGRAFFMRGKVRRESEELQK